MPGPGRVPGPGGSAPGGCLVRGLCLVQRGCAWSGGGRPGIPACTEADTLPPVDRHTPVKTLPWPNFVAASNKSQLI